MANNVERIFENNYEDFLPPKDLAAAHFLVGFALDTSSSMSGQAIENLNTYVNKFREELANNESTKDCCDISMVTFASEAKLRVGWRPISEMEPMKLTASGSTAMAEGLDMVLDLIEERSRYYEKDLGIRIYKPMLVLITDGHGNSPIDAQAARVKKRVKDGKLKIEVLAVEGYDAKSLGMLTENSDRPPFTMKRDNPYDFSWFFKYLANSIKTVSVSTGDGEVMVDNPLLEEGTNLLIERNKWKF